MKRLIKKAQITTFYHGSPLPRALGIFESGTINSINSQGDGAKSEQNVSMQNNSVYIATSKDVAKDYALQHNSYDFGIIFEMNLDTSTEPLLIDEDTFYWGEGLDEESENVETFRAMFDGDKAKASAFVENLLNDGFFEKVPYYNQWDDEHGVYKTDQLVAQDSEGYYFMDLNELQFGNMEKANELLRMIPFKDLLKANDTTFAYAGDISLSKMTKIYLVSKTEEYEFTNQDELVTKYNELIKKES